MPVELPYVNDAVQKPIETIRKPETEIFTNPKPNMELEIKPTGFPQTQKPSDAIILEKKKGKPRGVQDPEAKKIHMEKMRKASADSRAKKKQQKLQTIPENKLIQVVETPQLIPNPPPPTPVNMEGSVHSQPVEADQLRAELKKLQHQNNAYKTWYQENKEHLNKIPKQQPSQPINIPQQQYNNSQMNAGFDRLHSLEIMIRKDEREKMVNQQKLEREEQAKNLALNFVMPKGLQKWQNVNKSKTYKSNEDMWHDCFNPK